MSQVTIVTGCAGSGKTERLLAGYCAALRQARVDRKPGTALWLAPTRRIQSEIARRAVISDGAACFAINVLTFDLFAEKILHAVGSPETPISPVMKRLILRRIARSLRERGELRHFEPIAETTGFLDVVSSFISELKREEIWPADFVEACRERKSAFARRDLELGLIYDEYQRHLEEQCWYDNEGRFWLARDKIEKNSRDPFKQVRFLAVDGFTDFTQTQYEILGHLAGWIDQILLSVPDEQPTSRADLFTKPHAAIDRIREQIPDGVKFEIERLNAGSTSAVTETQPEIRRNWSASIRVLADRLFSNPRFGTPSPETAGLEVIEATGQNGEWEAVAARIKTMLAGGEKNGPGVARDRSTASLVRPQEIVIGLRSISDDGPRLRDYLTAAGLPVWCEAELPFTSSSIVKAVSSLLQLELEDWPFERLMGVLDSTFFQPGWPELRNGLAVRAVAASLRHLQLHTGRDLILRVLGRSLADPEPEAENAVSRHATTLRLAAGLLQRFHRSCERLRRSHTLADWTDVLAAVVDELGLNQPVAGLDEALQANESRDLDLLQRILRTAAEADQKLAGTSRPKKLTLAEFQAEFRDLLSHEKLKAPPEPNGCIRILSVEQIRNLDVPHLFLMGLTENSFPKSRSDDCLFSETERQDFISRGVALRHRSGHHSEEMFLFYSVVARARRSLTLSYPAVNSKGQPVFSSPYVTALKSLFVPGMVATSKEGQLDPVPLPERVLTQTDLRLAAMVEGLQGRAGLFRSAMELDSLRQTCWNTLAACDVADHRFHHQGFTAYEGRLESGQNLQHLQQRFGAHHQFSATELEAYARCPFQFWVSNVLRIGAVESPEEGTDHAGRGNLLHEVLARLLTEGAFEDPGGLPARFRELVEEQLGRKFPETELQRALLEIEQLILQDWSLAFARQHVTYQQETSELLKEVRSLDPEIAFGNLPDAPMTADVVAPPIEFGSDENIVKLRGRIDRIDVGAFEGRPAYVVVDYKTGQRPTFRDQDLVTGRSMQLALYLLVIKRLGLVADDAVPLQMGYWALRDSGFKAVLSTKKLRTLSPDKIQRMEAILDHLLPELAGEIRQGRFVVENSDLNCTGRCAYRTVCRVNQLRPLAESLRKLSPPRVDPTGADGGTDDE